MSWKKISEIIHSPISGEWGDEGDEVKVLRTTNFTNEGKLNLNNVVTRSVDLKKIEKKKLVYGDTIIEKSGGSPSQPVGRVVYFDISDEEYICNNFTSILRISDEKFDQKYFFWSLFYQHIAKNTLQFQNKTTGIINLQLTKYLEQTSLKELPLQTQKHIASILDKADAQRQQNRQLLAYYDALLQSTFIEMFGDPVKNSMGWEMRRMGDVSQARLGKMLDSKKQTGLSKHKYLGNSNVLWGKFKFDNLAEMDFSEKDIEEFSLRKGDLLICEGGEVGRCAIWKEELNDCYFQKAIHRVRLDFDILIPDYVQYLMWFYAKNGGLKDFVTIATIAHLTGVKLKSLPLPIPPLSIQKQFTQIVETIEFQKEKAQASLAESESLFQGLLSTYFGNN